MWDGYKTYKKCQSVQQSDETFLSHIAKDFSGDCLLIEEIVTADLPEIIRRLKSVEERNVYALQHIKPKMAGKFAEEMTNVLNWIYMLGDKLDEANEHLQKMIAMADQFDFVPKRGSAPGPSRHGQT